MNNLEFLLVIVFLFISLGNCIYGSKIYEKTFTGYIFLFFFYYINYNISNFLSNTLSKYFDNYSDFNKFGILIALITSGLLSLIALSIFKYIIASMVLYSTFLLSQKGNINVIVVILLIITFAILIYNFKKAMQIFIPSLIGSIFLLLCINILYTQNGILNYIRLSFVIDSKFVFLSVLTTLISCVLQYILFINTNILLNKSNNTKYHDIIDSKKFSPPIMPNYTNKTYQNHLKQWGNWNLEEQLGNGASGTVFKISKIEYKTEYISALKIISVPNLKQQKESQIHCKTEKDFENYYRSIVEDILQEINLLYSLKGNSHIVSYEDHSVNKRSNSTTWDILIKMEYLQSLNNYIEKNNLTLLKILDLGVDICSALEICENFKIQHRDIKIQNIFITNKDTFKLGDFGISKKLTCNISKENPIGTFMYIAPEIYNNSTYNNTTDIYSLGLVIYRLLNNNLAPFFKNKSTFTSNEVKQAIQERFSNPNIKYPINSKYKELNFIILKSCNFKPSKRYQKAADFKNALLTFKNSLSDTEKNKIIFTQHKSINSNQTIDYTQTINIESLDSTKLLSFPNKQNN